jgi:GNAT superfamily N-acetyltransferase
MINLRTECKRITLSAKNLIVNFDCGDEELNDFFNHKAFPFKEQLLARTIFFRHNETEKIVCVFSLSPNALKTTDLPGSRRKKVAEYIPREKSLQSYPAFLIGRLGVSVEFSRQGIGSQLVRYIKSYCLATYPDFCRFLVIDAYSIPSVLNFYRNNDFTLVFSTEEQERKVYNINADKHLLTRYLFFDMMQWKKITFS